MSAGRNLLCERAPFTPNDDVRRCILQEQRSYPPLGLHMMSTRFSTARTQGPARDATSTHHCENLKD